MVAPKNEIDVGKIRDIFYYDAIDGILKYRVRRGPLKPGDAAGTLNKNGYRQVRTCGRVLLAHRIIWVLVHGEWPNGLLDHRDLNKDNGRIENLRPSNDSLNHANTKTRRIGLKGVTLHKTGKFQAAIKKNGRFIYLGLFEKEMDAHEVYCRKAAELFGEHARFS